MDYIFVHIPRTAGRSISSALGIEFPKEHKSISDYVKELTEPVVRNRFKFTVVRNPWDRAVSCWAFFHVGTCSKFINHHAMDFDSWIKNGADDLLNQLSYCKIGDELLIDEFLKYETLDKDFTSIANRFGVLPILPRIGQEDKHKIGKQSIQVDGKPPLGLAEDYRDMYSSQQTIDIVGSLNADLVGRFGYSF